MISCSCGLSLSDAIAGTLCTEDGFRAPDSECTHQLVHCRSCKSTALLSRIEVRQYALSTGGRLRNATMAVLPSGDEVRFAERLTRREAARAVAEMGGTR